MLRVACRPAQRRRRAGSGLLWQWRDRGDSDGCQCNARLSRANRLPSRVRLDPAKARSAISVQIALDLSLALEEAAYGSYLAGCAGIARAVRALTIERGRDPRYPLFRAVAV